MPGVKRPETMTDDERLDRIAEILLRGLAAADVAGDPIEDPATGDEGEKATNAKPKRRATRKR